MKVAFGIKSHSGWAALVVLVTRSGELQVVCMATGGPCKYTGRMMKDSHKHLNITGKEWDAMVADFKETLNRFNLPEKEQNGLIAVVGSTKKDIVMHPNM